MREVTIRDEPHTVLQAINRQIGQIVFLANTAVERMGDADDSPGEIGRIQDGSAEDEQAVRFYGPKYR